MKTSELDFKLPEELIAKHPADPRDSAKMMVLEPKSQKISNSYFYNLSKYLKSGDVLVFNQTKVFPARTFGTKETGGKVEALFLQEVSPKIWEVIIGGNVKDGQRIILSRNVFGIIKKEIGGTKLVVNLTKEDVYRYLDAHGEVPLPPYIKRDAATSDKNDYQAVFAKNLGSAAAPTASLHFTNKLLSELHGMGVEIEYVTLHVGLGTFAPVKTEKLEEHPIHSEYYEIDAGTAERLNMAKKSGKRVIACGTTVMRTLEAAAFNGTIKSGGKETNLFIYPGYKFRFVDGLITNFHTPRSSLLALVYTFAGKGLTQKAYQKAIKEKYRFYSYGDGMLII